jgi:hypothetical protein
MPILAPGGGGGARHPTHLPLCRRAVVQAEGGARWPGRGVALKLFFQKKKLKQGRGLEAFFSKRKIEKETGASVVKLSPLFLLKFC